PEEHLREHRLAAPRLPNDRNDLAVLDGEAHAVDGDGALLSVPVGAGEIARFELERVIRHSRTSPAARARPATPARACGTPAGPSGSARRSGIRRSPWPGWGGRPRSRRASS